MFHLTYDGDNNRIFDITYTSASGNADFDSEIRSAYVKENGVTLSWKCIDPACHKHFDHENCQILHPKEDEENEDFVKSVLDDTLVVAGDELLPVKKTSSNYVGYDLTYYLNDVTIDNAEVLVEYDSDGLAKSTYQYGLERLSVESGNTMSQYFLYNGTGSVVQTSEENGSLALRYTYDPFGTPSVRAPALISLADTPSYTYNGESYNYTTGLQYLRARYYNTSTGNFISQDTYLGDTLNSVTLNRYTYANNNPVMYDDPSGHWALWDNIKESVSDFANDVKDTVTESYNKVKDKVVEVYNDAKTFVEEKIDQAKEFAENVECQAIIKTAQATVDVFGADNVTKAVNTVNNTVKQAKQWVDDKWEQACEFSQDKLGIDLERTVNGVMKVVNTVSTVAAAVTAFSVAMAATGGLALVAAPALIGFASVSAVYSVAEGIEGLQDVYYGMQGDSETQSFNFVRDTIYADNPDLYYQHKAIADTGTQMLTGFVGKHNLSSKSDYDVPNSSTNTSNANKGIECPDPPSQCFVEGTQVLTPDGNVNIEDIEIGDTVIATDPETGETEEKEVVETYVNETEELIHVWVDGEEIITTPTHPFYVPEKGWTYAVELKAGDRLQLVNGEYVTVEAVQHELLEEPVKVYNFQVKDFHTYYVGTDVSVLVHNMCKKLVGKGEQFANRRKNKLKSNIRYQTGEFDYFYETDDLGRINKFTTDELKLTERTERLDHSKNTPGKIKGKDHAGHLAGDRFGGSPKLDNLVSQSSDVNLSKFKIIENKWAEALDQGNKVSVDMVINYDSNKLRPSSFDVNFTITDKDNNTQYFFEHINN